MPGIEVARTTYYHGARFLSRVRRDAILPRLIIEHIFNFVKGFARSSGMCSGRGSVCMMETHSSLAK